MKAPFDRSLTSAEGRPVELEPAVIGGHAGAHARCCERQHPADIRGGDEVPGRAHHVRAKDLSLAEREFNLIVSGAPHPQPKCPLRVGVLLRLHRAKPADDVFRIRKAGAGQTLIAESQACDAERHVTGILRCLGCLECLRCLKCVRCLRCRRCRSAVSVGEVFGRAPTCGTCRQRSPEIERSDSSTRVRARPSAMSRVARTL